jgi:hypothetical protein
VSRIFLSHSSADNAATVALRDWLIAEGWNDLFVDLDAERGIAPGERWERALNEAASRCEAVVILVSKAWLSSRWCMNELNLARRLNKRLFGVLIEEGITVDQLPGDVTGTWQLVNLAAGRDHRQFRVTMPNTGEEVHVTYSLEGLARLRTRSAPSCPITAPSNGHPVRGGRSSKTGVPRQELDREIAAGHPNRGTRQPWDTPPPAVPHRWDSLSLGYITGLCPLSRCPAGAGAGSLRQAGPTICMAAARGRADAPICVEA